MPGLSYDLAGMDGRVLLWAPWQEDGGLGLSNDDDMNVDVDENGGNEDGSDETCMVKMWVMTWKGIKGRLC